MKTNKLAGISVDQTDGEPINILPSHISPSITSMSNNSLSDSSFERVQSDSPVSDYTKNIYKGGVIGLSELLKTITPYYQGEIGSKLIKISECSRHTGAFPLNFCGICPSCKFSVSRGKIMYNVSRKISYLTSQIDMYESYLDQDGIYFYRNQLLDKLQGLEDQLAYLDGTDDEVIIHDKGKLIHIPHYSITIPLNPSSDAKLEKQIKNFRKILVDNNITSVYRFSRYDRFLRKFPHVHLICNELSFPGELNYINRGYIADLFSQIVDSPNSIFIETVTGLKHLRNLRIYFDHSNLHGLRAVSLSGRSTVHMSFSDKTVADVKLKDFVRRGLLPDKKKGWERVGQTGFYGRKIKQSDRRIEFLSLAELWFHLSVRRVREKYYGVRSA